MSLVVLRHFLPAVIGAILAAVGFSLAFQGELFGLLPTLLGCAAIVYASGIVQEWRRRIQGDHRPTPAAPSRPDVDVAQYLNDGDRAWLMEHGDWTDPATRIVERPSSASDTLAADRKRRAEQVVSQMDSTDGWRTTRYADGRTVEHAVTDETSSRRGAEEMARRAGQSEAVVREYQRALAEMDRVAAAAIEAAQIDRALAGLNYTRKCGPVPGMAAGGAVRAEPSDIDGRYRPIGMVGADEGLDHRPLIDPDWRK